MAYSLKVKNVVSEGNYLDAEVDFYNPRESKAGGTLSSKEYLINSLVAFQAKGIISGTKVQYCVAFVKKRENDKSYYAVKYSHKMKDSTEATKHEMTICFENSCTQIIGQYEDYSFTFYVHLELITFREINPCRNLYDDTELIDVELCGVDGSVHLHKAIAAAYSPVMKAGFKRDWKNDAQCVIKAPPGTTKETLEHLKDYMYLNTLPSTGVEELLLLASFYMMTNLEQQCAQEVITDVTSEEAYRLFEFGMKHQMSQIIFEIMRRVQNGLLTVDDIQKHQKWE